MALDNGTMEPENDETVTGSDPKDPAKPRVSRSGISLKLPRSMRNVASLRELKREIERQVREQDPDIPDDILKEIVGNITADVKQDERRNFLPYRLLRLVLPIAVIGTMFIMTALIAGQAWEPKVEKAAIQQDLLAAVRNGADVETLKMIYRTRAMPTESLGALIHSRDYYSKTNTTLMDVLNDLKTKVLIQKDVIADQDKAFVGRIDEILLEYSKVNPFDGLEENQRRDLANLAKKLPAANYAVIADDIASLVVELKQKNSLVTKYLNSSEVSLWISIIALALTIGLGFWQFRPKARKTQKELIQEALSEFNRKRPGERA